VLSYLPKHESLVLVIGHVMTQLGPAFQVHWPESLRMYRITCQSWTNHLKERLNGTDIVNSRLNSQYPSLHIEIYWTVERSGLISQKVKFGSFASKQRLLYHMNTTRAIYSTRFCNHQTV